MRLAGNDLSSAGASRRSEPRFESGGLFARYDREGAVGDDSIVWWGADCESVVVIVTVTYEPNEPQDLVG